MKHLSGAPFYGRLLALPPNIRLGWKRNVGDRYSSLLRKFVNYGQKKVFFTLGPDIFVVIRDSITLCYCSTFKLGSSLLRSTFVFMRHFGAKTISSRSHFEDDSSPHISGSGSLIRIDLRFVLFKHFILMRINYLET